jgi:hypothetical protein
LKVWTAIASTTTFEDGPFIPINSEPQQIFDESNTRCVARSLLICIFDTQYKSSASTFGKSPTEERSACPSNMQMT